MTNRTHTSISPPPTDLSEIHDWPTLQRFVCATLKENELLLAQVTRLQADNTRLVEENRRLREENKVCGRVEVNP